MIRIFPAPPPKTYIIIHKKYSIFNYLFLFYIFYKFSIKNRFLYKTVFFFFFFFCTYFKFSSTWWWRWRRVNMTFWKHRQWERRWSLTRGLGGGDCLGRQRYFIRTRLRQSKHGLFVRWAQLKALNLNEETQKDQTWCPDLQLLACNLIPIWSAQWTAWEVVRSKLFRRWSTFFFKVAAILDILIAIWNACVIGSQRLPAYMSAYARTLINFMMVSFSGRNFTLKTNYILLLSCTIKWPLCYFCNIDYQRKLHNVWDKKK